MNWINRYKKKLGQDTEVRAFSKWLWEEDRQNWEIERYAEDIAREEYERGYRDYAIRCKEEKIKTAEENYSSGIIDERENTRQTIEEALEEAGKEYHKHATKKFALDPESFYAGKIKALEELLE